MSVGAISSMPFPVAASAASPAADQAFSLKAAERTGDTRVASDSIPKDPSGMPDFCENFFNSVVRDVNELFDLLATDDPSLEAKLDQLDLRINTLITFCGEYLPKSALDKLRGMRELIDAMRGALGFVSPQGGEFTLPQPDTGGVGRILSGIWEALHVLAPFFGSRLGERPGLGSP